VAHVRVRGMASAMPYWRRESLGQGRPMRCVVARRPWAGWTVVWAAVIAGEAQNTFDLMCICSLYPENEF
jgi:hypothetical protein